MGGKGRSGECEQYKLISHRAVEMTKCCWFVCVGKKWAEFDLHPHPLSREKKENGRRSGTKGPERSIFYTIRDGASICQVEMGLTMA